MMAVVALASCSANSDFDNTNTTDPNTKESVQSPVEFGTYLAQSKNTRAGEDTPASASDAPEMTTDELKTKGFGVIAFYTESSKYEEVRASEVPNFMYNTKVSGNGWTYTPIKYWPNGGQTGDATPEKKTQYLSFFAYAPYKDFSTTSTTGITALSTNDKKGDPTVTYTLGATGADADLLWGTAGSNDVTNGVTNGAKNGTTTSGVSQDGTDLGGKAKVNANLSKMMVDGKVTFNFKHALAKFGGTGATASDNKTSGLMVVADIDNGYIPTTKDGSLGDITKITVKSIKIESVIEGTNGNMTPEASIPTSGTFNLVTGKWETTGTMGKIDYEINSPKADPAPKDATTQTMNTDIAEPASVSSWDDLKNVTGVTTTAKSVYTTETTPLLIIPDGNAHTFRITIDYIVRTKDDALHQGYTQVEQSFYKDLTLSNVSLNAKYNLLIHLGLTSVKFDAYVSTWDNTANGGTTNGSSTDSDPMVIYMPANVK